ncbi:MAG: zf-HC2 domain-containing protein [Magnetococcales bacterium]|nr:zf-HC2 domain-containing protein [Magnetococcales bacterium]MBF0114188.1 zf-HC2 domain-containing protein [Magnetococcales bacterium]
MACNPELVSAFLDGELETVILHPVVAHLMQCDHCCQTMGWLAQVKEGIAGHYWNDSEDLTQSIMGAIRNEKVYSRHTSLFERLRRFGVPAVLLATALAQVQALEAEDPAQQSDLLFRPPMVAQAAEIE